MNKNYIVIFLLLLSVETFCIDSLHVEGENFVNDRGEIVRLWGVNVVAFYPDHQTAIKFAENLAAHGINCVRWHHMLRYSSDWNWNSGIYALVTYDNDSRTPNAEAWDRFDFLNAELEKRGIYIMLSGHWTREYLPGDVDILQTDTQDRTEWMNAMQSLNELPWDHSIDKRKMLVTFDERCARLDEEFIEYLLNHENPYMNNLKYKDNPQVLTFEMLNEFSSEYTIYMGNRFDNSGLEYWHDKLQQKFDQYCDSIGVSKFTIYDPVTSAQERARSDFLIKLDRDYFTRIKEFIMSLNPTNNMNITFSNLWRGERSAELLSEVASYIEDHIYPDPFVVGQREDFVYQLSNYLFQSGKPYVVGELNMYEWDVPAMRNHRTMLYLTAAVYGAFHNWSGIVWFAWNHGDRYVNSDGLGVYSALEPPDDVIIGGIIHDESVRAHFRTAGTIFKRGLVSTSIDPKVLWVDETYMPYYPWPVPPMYKFKPGWQNIHSIRKMYGDKPADQDNSPMMTENPPHPYISDTGEILMDTTKKQISFSTDKAEGFSGYLNDGTPQNLNVLSFSETEGFATVMIVAADDKDFSASDSLIVSRTYLLNGQTTNGPNITLSQLKPESGSYKWYIKYTKPQNGGNTYKLLPMNAQGKIELPNTNWVECELIYSDQITSVKDNESRKLGKGELKFYPNPFYGAATVELTAFESPVTIRIFDVLGQLIYEKKLNEKIGSGEKVTFRIDSKELNLNNSGIFFISVNNGKTKHVKKIINLR